jgi:hypothetical protein
MATAHIYCLRMAYANDKQHILFDGLRYLGVLYLSYLFQLPPTAQHLCFIC